MPKATIIKEMATIDSSAINGHYYIVAATYGRSVWMREISTDDQVTSVAQSGSTTPRGFALGQNYPNPFNPITHFGFRLPAGKAEIADFARLPARTSLAGGPDGQGFVSLKVYDVLGREVKTLVNEELRPGSYEATFDATGIASGVYLYKLQTGSYSAVKKMILTN